MHYKAQICLYIIVLISFPGHNAEFRYDPSHLGAQDRCKMQCGRYFNTAPDPGINSTNTVAAGYIFADKTDRYLNLTDPIDLNLSAILDRHGPDMRASRDYKDFKDISLDVAKRAWQLLHKHAAKAISDRIGLAWPAIEQLLHDARVSRDCVKSTKSLFDGAIRMDSWAIKLLNSWGTFPPAGIFEGTYGEVGSYQTCVNIPKNDYIDHAHYCSVHFRPIIPSRGDYDLVVSRLPGDLLNMFENRNSSGRNNANSNSRNAFSDILEHAQYHHFVYYKWGTCWPIKCSPFDIKRVVKLVGRRNMLMNGPVKCFSKHKDDYEEPDVEREKDGTLKKLVISIWDANNGIFISKPHFVTTQKVALAILAALTSFIVLMTIVDFLFVRMPQMFSMINLVIFGAPLDNLITAQSLQMEQQITNGNMNSVKNTNPTEEEQRLPLQDDAIATVESIKELTSSKLDSMSKQDEKTLYKMAASEKKPQLTGLLRWVDDCSMITNTIQFFRVSQGQLKNDILCLNGLRCITMAWVCLTHTMMYCDYSGFARTREIEKSVKSIFGQPLFNGSYLVDTFFLVSGLLGAYTTFKSCKGMSSKFNVFAYIIGRWLRLTPQIFLVNLLFIVLPAISDGPHWYPLVAEYSENCVSNWWVNLLHMQAFFDTEKMCNFVTWWVSIDFFFHMIALSIILVILYGNHRFGLMTMAGLVGSQVAWQIIRHYQMGFPPNVLSTIPQTGAMWTDFTRNFFWKPYTHAVPYFFGFYIGYLMAMKQKLMIRFLNPRRALIGWSMAITGLTCLSYSTYWWVIGSAQYSKWISTLHYTICPFVWSASICWIIVACYYGYGGFLDRFLSMRFFVILGKSSYLIYLSHFQILFIFFGNAKVLFEPSELVMFYIVLGNTFLSTLYGIFLSIVYEFPWIRIHSKLMKHVQIICKKLC